MTYSFGELDYGDFVYELVQTHNIDGEDAFYFFEECEDTPNFFDDCKSYDEAIKKVVNSYNKETY